MIKYLAEVSNLQFHIVTFHQFENFFIYSIEKLTFNLIVIVKKYIHFFQNPRKQFI